MSKGKGAPILSLKGITHIYHQGMRDIEVLKQADLTLRAGETVGLVGPSGSGKSTLLHLAGLLDLAQSGQVFLEGVDVTTATDRQRTALRREKIGFVYQFHNLLPEFSAVENIMMPLRIAGQSKAEAQARGMELLVKLELEDRAAHLPSEMSGGEQQRVAIGRALANRPALIIADEPTGSLDPRTGAQVFDILVQTAREQGVAVLVATHNLALADKLDRIIHLADGRLG